MFNAENWKGFACDDVSGEKDSYNDIRFASGGKNESALLIVRLINIRLVNRRIEQRQEHNITRTEITQRWLTYINHAVTHAETDTYD